MENELNPVRSSTSSIQAQSPPGGEETPTNKLTVQNRSRHRSKHLGFSTQTSSRFRRAIHEELSEKITPATNVRLTAATRRSNWSWFIKYLGGIIAARILEKETAAQPREQELLVGREKRLRKARANPSDVSPVRWEGNT